MAGYVGAVYYVNDPAGFEAYRSVALPTVEQYGGKFIGGGESVEVREGDRAPPRPRPPDSPNIVTLQAPWTIGRRSRRVPHGLK